MFIQLYIHFNLFYIFQWRNSHLSAHTDKWVSFYLWHGNKQHFSIEIHFPPVSNGVCGAAKKPAKILLSSWQKRSAYWWCVWMCLWHCVCARACTLIDWFYWSGSVGNFRRTKIALHRFLFPCLSFIQS